MEAYVTPVISALDESISQTGIFFEDRVSEGIGATSCPHACVGVGIGIASRATMNKGKSTDSKEPQVLATKQDPSGMCPLG
jgi:hypothetical protein